MNKNKTGKSSLEEFQDGFQMRMNSNDIVSSVDNVAELNWVYSAVK